MQNKPKLAEPSFIQWFVAETGFNREEEAEYRKSKHELQRFSGGAPRVDERLKYLDGLVENWRAEGERRRALAKRLKTPAPSQQPTSTQNSSLNSQSPTYSEASVPGYNVVEKSESGISSSVGSSPPAAPTSMIAKPGTTGSDNYGRESAKDEYSKPQRFINSLEPGPDGRVHYSPAYPTTPLEGEPIKSPPMKSGDKTAPSPESDAESLKSVLAWMASRSIVPSKAGLLGTYDGNGCMIGIRTIKCEKGLVTEFVKRERILATFDEGELRAELKKAQTY
jgi:hypothetical protein